MKRYYFFAVETLIFSIIATSSFAITGIIAARRGLPTFTDPVTLSFYMSDVVSDDVAIGQPENLFSRANAYFVTSHHNGDQHLINLTSEVQDNGLVRYTQSFTASFSLSAFDSQGLQSLEFRADDSLQGALDGTVLGSTQCDSVNPCSLYVPAVYGSPSKPDAFMYLGFNSGTGTTPYFNLSNFTHTGHYILIGRYATAPQVRYSIFVLGGTSWPTLPKH